MLKEKEAALKRAEEKQLERELLPHRHLFPWYPWAWDFYTSKEKKYFLTAANQISKSSTQIRKCIEWATNKKIWKHLWKTEPNLFWYFYPASKTINEEFDTKWMLFLPKDKNHPVYGWKTTMNAATKSIGSIDFKSGVKVVFKSYSQDISNLQAGSVYAMFLDEEPPAEYMPELSFRVAATDGYIHAVFTATLGQEYWRRTMEPNSEEEELHKDAKKRQISLYDAQFYMDGTPSPWTMARIKQVENLCTSKEEIDRRVHGKFVVIGGRLFGTFQPSRDKCDPEPIPTNWPIYSAVDYGSGTDTGHPAGIVFVAVSPDYKMGRVVRCWRGDSITTTATTLYEKYVELEKEVLSRGNPIVMKVYDYSSRDFYTISTSRGDSFVAANKSREEGIAVVNSLFDNEMLKIHGGDPENEKLVIELASLLSVTSKTVAKDDLADPLRYICLVIPWDWSVADEYQKKKAANPIVMPKIKVESPDERALRERREWVLGGNNTVDFFDQEIAELNELYGS